MTFRVKAFAALPLVAAVGVLIGWLANGAKVPWALGWQVTMPLLALIPLWADLLGQLQGVEAGSRTWKNFPATCYLAMSAVIGAWALGFVNPTAVLTKPICGPVPSTCLPDGSLSMTNLCLDVASVALRIDAAVANQTVSVYTAYANCWDCLPQRTYFGAAGPADVNIFYLPTKHYMTTLSVALGDANGREIVRHTLRDVAMGDQGEYMLYVQPEALTLSTVTDPWWYEGPLVVLVVLCVALQALYSLANAVAARMHGDAGEDLCGAVRKTVRAVVRQDAGDAGADGDGEALPLAAADAPAAVAATPAKRRRILALDVLRGLSLVIMNCANYGGFGYWFLDHSKWDGLTIADLVFPWFVWIMGVAMAVTLESKRARANRGATLLAVLRRSALLVLVSMLLGTSQLSSFAHLRIPGVLSRFGLSYLVVALAILFVPKPSADSPVANVQEASGDAGPPPSSCADPPSFVWRWLAPSLREAPVFAALLAAWVGVTFGASFDRDGERCHGYLGPGGISQMGRHSSCTGGIANYLDHKLFAGHMWGGCFPCDTYMAFDVAHHTCTPLRGHDPEGLLGSLNSIVLCWFGLVAGRIVTASGALPGSRRAAAASLVVVGGVLCLAAAILCEFRQFGGFIPVNKNLWSTSFILVMSGTGTLLLLVLLYLVDWAQLWQGKPFLFVGMNSILYYCTHEVCGKPSGLGVWGGGAGGSPQLQATRMTMTYPYPHRS